MDGRQTAAHNVFAQILEGEVKNVAIFDNYPNANHITKIIYGSEAFAVDCTAYPISIGDKYHDNCFWRVLEDGTEEVINPLPTEEDRIQSLESKMTTINRFSKASFEMFSSSIDTSAITFTEESGIVEFYIDEYLNANEDINVVPNVGNLRTVILGIVGPPSVE